MSDDSFADALYYLHRCRESDCEVYTQAALENIVEPRLRVAAVLFRIELERMSGG
jgi:hypothetical protein